MARGWIVAVSIATHVVVLGVLDATRTAATTAPEPSIPGPNSSLTPVEPPPIEVVLLDDPVVETRQPAPAAPAPAGQALRAHAESYSVPRHEVGGTPGEPGNVPAPAPDAGPAKVVGPKLSWKMRYGPQFHSSIESLLDQAADMPPGTPPPQLVPSGLLHPDGGGTARGNGGEFTATVARDGSIALHDGSNVRLGARPGPPVNDGPATVLSFDATDALMRAHGIDPYAAAKAKFLDKTRAERVEMGLAYRAEQLAQTAPTMRKNIARAFVMFVDPAARRRALFELWDDCAETGPDALVEAGRVGRALVIGAIRTKFPAGSATAYTAAEITELSRRRSSRAVFAPYE